MEMGELMQKRLRAWRAFGFVVLLWSTIDAQVRYTIPEELKVGFVVGNISKDLGLALIDIAGRKLQMASESERQYFGVDLQKGELIINERIDREDICGSRVSCTQALEVIIENPLQMFRVEIEIQDINDNIPTFPSNHIVINVDESILSGTRFRLESAKDPDLASNSLKEYILSENEYFVLNVKDNKDGTKVPELVLEKTLDREKQTVHSLVLTAVDGGNPPRSGTAEIIVRVQDSNDNTPSFEKPSYTVKVSENAQLGTEVLTVKANDHDDGVNGEIVYSFDKNTPEIIQNLFFIDSERGTITVKGRIDFESSSSFRFDVIASDKGASPLESLCSVIIEILDVNDNVPEIVLKSPPKPVMEDAPPGTVVALIGSKDGDSGDNGKVQLSIPAGLPFRLKPSFSNYFELVTVTRLDRETFPTYNIEITAKDSGSIPLQSKTQITVDVIDVNDNPPIFSELVYIVYVKENNAPGSALYSVSAIDTDLGENAKISYTILDTKVQDVSVSSYVYVNSDNGTIFSMHAFDYERMKLFQIHIQAKDHGTPSLSSNATVHVFILDQNDNVPSVIYPSAVMGSVSHQRMPRSAKAGHLVTKVTAVDADAGHNAWISYRIAEATDMSLFSVNLHTGQVRTKRSVSEQDDASQRLFIEIKDNGEPVQSTTVTVDILIEDGLHEPLSDNFQKKTVPSKKSDKMTLYLIISLASVSVLSLLTFVILLVKCARKSTGNCCIRQSDCDGYKNPNRNLQIQLNSDGPIKYVEVLGGDMLSHSQSFGSCLSPLSEFSDFTLVKPSSTLDFKELNVLDASLPDNAWTFESQQVRLKAHAGKKIRRSLVCI